MKTMSLCLVSLFVILSTGYAQKYHHGMSPGQQNRHRFQMQKKFQMLDLTNEQKENIDAVKDETKRKIIPIRADIELKRIDLENEMKVDEPNRNKIMKMTEEISDLQLKIKQTAIDEKLKINATLTPEQKEQLQMPIYQLMKKQQKKN